MPQRVSVSKVLKKCRHTQCHQQEGEGNASDEVKCGMGLTVEGP